METVDIRSAGASTPAYLTKETYNNFPWGFEIIETRVDPDNNAATTNDLVTTFTYHTDTNDVAIFRKQRSVIYPDGYWERRDYDDDYTPGPLHVLYSPNLDDIFDPELATKDNSVWADYYYDDYSMDTLNVIRHYTQDEYGYFRYEARAKYSEGGFDKSFDGARELTATPWYSGKYSETYDDTWGIGYAGHTIYSKNYKDAEEQSYYHGGVYTNDVFTPSGSYIWEGPDWRHSTLFTGLRNDQEPAYENTVYLDVYSAEGEPLSGSALYAWQYDSWKTTEVYHNGSLSMKEMYIFTNVDGGTGEPQFDLAVRTVILNDSLGHATNITQIDPVTGYRRVLHEYSYRGATNDTDLLQWEIDEYGVKKSYTYDSLKRTIEERQEGVSASGSYPSQSDRVQTVTYDAYNRTLSTILSGGSATVTNTVAFDVAGRITSVIDTNALTTSYSYELGGRRVTKTMPNGRTEIRENYLDRRLKSVTGTGVNPEYHEWKYANLDDAFGTWADGTIHGEDGRGRVWHQTRYGTTNSLRLKWETVDWLNKTNQTEVADYVTTNFINQRFEFMLPSQKFELPQSRADSRLFYKFGVARNYAETFQYDFAGRLSIHKVPLYDESEYPTNNRVSVIRITFQNIGGSWFEVTSNLVCRSFDTEDMTPAKITLRRLNGFSSSNIVSQVTTTDAATNDTVFTIWANRASKLMTTITDVPQSSLNSTNITRNELLQSTTTSSIAAPVTYAYDNLGRILATTNSLGFVQSTTYNSAGFVDSTTDSAGLVTAVTYYVNGQDGAGKPKIKTVGGKNTYFAYTNSGVWRIWGNVPFPEERFYSVYGEMIELHTFRAGSGWAGST